MLSETNPETSSNGTGGTTYYVYDSDATCGNANGDQVKRTDPAGNVSCYAYDGVHRLTSVTYPSGPNAANMPRKDFWYDAASWYGLTLSNPKGHLVGARTWNNSAQTWTSLEGFSYDIRGQATDYYQTSTNSGGWYHIQQSYAANGNRANVQGFLTNGSPFTHSFTYDNNEGEGRPRGLTDTTVPVPVWASTTYNPAGQPTVIPTIGGSVGSPEVFTYDPNTGRMTQWQSSNSAVNKSQTGTLTWNANGTLQQLAIADTYNSTNNQTCLYGYDDLARLLSANCNPLWAQTFSYDTFGNITKTGSVTFNSGYGSGNHVSGFSYDGMGNVTNDGGSAYSYDAEGRPVSVAGTQVVYDAFNRAVERNSGSTHSQVVYDPQGAKFAFMSGQTLQTYMLPFAGGVQAVFNSVGLQYIRHADWLGSARLELDVNGNLYAARSYAPYGETYSGAGTGGTDRVFTGQTQDVIMGPTGIYDFLFRQHSSGQGRWLVPDPAGLAAVDLTNPQTWNRYAYVGNNPMSNVDPLGLSCEDPHDGQPCVVQVTATADPVPLLYHSPPFKLTIQMWDDTRGDEKGQFTFKVTVHGNPPTTTTATNASVSAYKGPEPTRLKLTVPGTRYCGLGGSGKPKTQVDQMCKEHDACYEAAGVSFWTNIGMMIGLPMPSHQPAVDNCNQIMCENLSGLLPENRSENAQASVVGFAFGCVP